MLLMVGNFQHMAITVVPVTGGVVGGSDTSAPGLDPLDDLSALMIFVTAMPIP